MSTIMNYDPNLLCSGNMAKQTINLTFAEWDYRVEFQVVVGGNLRGGSIIEAAIEKVFDEHFDEDRDAARIDMENAAGDRLINDEIEDWEDLKDKLIKAEIVAIVPDKHIREVAA